MKGFLKKRWHRIPVGIIAAVLLVCLVAGGTVLAAGYNFFNADIEVEVQEAIYPSALAGDDLVPYMVDGSQLPLITFSDEGWTDIPPIVFDFVITEYPDPGVDASEFLPGEELVLPINLRNRSNADMPINVTVAAATGLDLAWVFETNTSGAGYVPTGEWAAFPSTFTITTRGNYGSAGVGATVLFIKIGVPLDAEPGTSTLTITFNRG